MGRSSRRRLGRGVFHGSNRALDRRRVLADDAARQVCDARRLPAARELAAAQRLFDGTGGVVVGDKAFCRQARLEAGRLSARTPGHPREAFRHAV